VAGFLGLGALHVLSLIFSHPWMPQSILDMLGITASVASGLSVLAWPTALLALTSGLIGLYYMYRCYRIPARPFWNHRSTATHFVGNSLNLGALFIALIFTPIFAYYDFSISALISTMAAVSLLGLSMEFIGLMKQGKEFDSAKHEGAASHYIQKTTFGKTYQLRNAVLLANMVLAGTIAFAISNTALAIACLLLLTMGSLLTAVIGRALFYVLVIPTTMPGAFFWRNKGFVEHARDIGMDHMPNTGVVPARH
jgi:DMSO reductase anchor subunit